MTRSWNWGMPGFCSSGSAIYLAYSHMGNSGSPGAATGSPRAAWVESEPPSDTDHVLLAEASAASVSR